MDYDSRSFEERPLRRFPPPPNSAPSAYFASLTEQDRREILTGTGLGRLEFRGNQYEELREAVRLEFERERIRGRIITEEIARRRFLEDELRREVILERESAMRSFRLSPGYGSSLDSRGPLLTNFQGRAIDERMSLPPNREVGLRAPEVVPFQRHPLAASGTPNMSLHNVRQLPPEAGTVKVINLAKPVTTLSGLKRKVESPSTAATTASIELPSTGLKKKAKEQWNCALCQVSPTSEKTFNEHLEGRKHKAKVAALAGPKTGFCASPLPQKSFINTSRPIKILNVANVSNLKQDGGVCMQTTESKGVNQTEEKTIDSDKLDDKAETTLSNKTATAISFSRTGEAFRPPKDSQTKFWCAMCQVEVNSLKMMNAHKRGKKHMAKLLRQLNQKISAASSTNNIGQMMDDMHELAEEVNTSLNKKQKTRVSDAAEEELVEDEMGSVHGDSTVVWQ